MKRILKLTVLITVLMAVLFLVMGCCAGGHSYSESTVKEPSCTGEGILRYTCVRCGDSYEEKIPAAGHSPVNDAEVIPTCTEDGLTKGTHCGVCGEILEPQDIIPAAGHKYITVEGIPATCTENGVSEGEYCEICGFVSKEQTVIAATGHRWIPATYKNPKTCELCGLTEGEPVKALSADEVYDKCASSVFMIRLFDRNGNPAGTASGFFVGPDGTALTAFHVMGSCITSKAVTDDGTEHDILGVYAYNRYDDWAVIKVDIKNNTYIPVADGSSVVPDADTYVIAYPGGLGKTMEHGKVTAVTITIDSSSYIEMSNAVSEGSSGGAVINKYGEYIGIVSAAVKLGSVYRTLAVPFKIVKIPAADAGYLTIPAFIDELVGNPAVYLRFLIFENGTGFEDRFDVPIGAYTFDSGEIVYIFLKYTLFDDTVALEERHIFPNGDTIVTVLPVATGFELLKDSVRVTYEYTYSNGARLIAASIIDPKTYTMFGNISFATVYYGGAETDLDLHLDNLQSNINNMLTVFNSAVTLIGTKDIGYLAWEG